MRRMSRVGLSIPLLLLGAVITGCGGSSGTSSVAPISAPPAQTPAHVLPMLATRTLPDLDHSDRDLGLPVLAAEGPKGGELDARLADWSYKGGSEREFKGGSPSQYLDVVSRTLMFGSAAGAHDFVEFVRTHPGTYVGALRRAEPVSADGRNGYLLVARGCGCHRETPLMLYVGSNGKRVTWLMANGPQVTPGSTLQLAARAP
jgi:hypothetical protein